MTEAQVELECPACNAREIVPSDATERRCRACGLQYAFLQCSSCRSTAQVKLTDGLLPRTWSCPSCQASVRAAFFDEPARGSASTIHDQVADPDSRTIHGFTIIGGSGFDLPPTLACFVRCTSSAVSITTTGAAHRLTLPYESLIAVELSGGTQTTGGGLFGGGLGLDGAVEGMAIASLLNTLSKKTTINTVLRIGTRDGEVFLHHGAVTPAQMRTALSLMFTRFEAARSTRPEGGAGDDPTTQLERLTRLRDAGTLTEEEFQAARAPVVARLLQSG